MANQYLLIQDVEGLGHRGDILKNLKPGYVRNFLLPKKLIVLADKQTLRLQQKLKEEREKQRLLDKQQSEEIAVRVEGMILTRIVKVDQDGHLYGSVNKTDILDQLKQELNIELDKKSIQLVNPLKTVGVYSIPLKLKEAVMTSVQLKIISEEQHRQEEAAKSATV